MSNCKKPKPGDLIEVDRVMYQHWGVYIGYGEVVHFGALGDVNSSKSMSDTDGVVRRDSLADVVGDSDWRVNNKKHGLKPRPQEEIVKAALAEVGKKMRYNLVSNNCEHFATKLRYGRAMSTQVQKAAVAGAGLLASSAMVSPGLMGTSALGAASSLASFASRSSNR